MILRKFWSSSWRFPICVGGFLTVKTRDWVGKMENILEKLVRSEEKIKEDILSDFVNEFCDEVEKLLNTHSKEELMKLID